MLISVWHSDVCSSDLLVDRAGHDRFFGLPAGGDGIAHALGRQLLELETVFGKVNEVTGQQGLESGGRIAVVANLVTDLPERAKVLWIVVLVFHPQGVVRVPERHARGAGRSERAHV